MLACGWLNSEDWGVWASQTEAWLKVPHIAEEGDDILLRIVYRLPQWEGRHKGQIFIWVNGEEISGGIDNSAENCEP